MCRCVSSVSGQYFCRSFSSFDANLLMYRLMLPVLVHMDRWNQEIIIKSESCAVHVVNCFLLWKDYRVKNSLSCLSICEI